MRYCAPTLALITLVASAGACVAPSDDDTGEGTALDDSAEWNDTYDNLVGGKADDPWCSGVIVPDRPGFGGRVALTFDDGPSTATTPQVLDILAARQIKATFFINGSVVGSAQRAVLQRIADEGHLIGNHSQSHLNLRDVSLATLDSEVLQTEDILVELGETRRFFRFPYGSAGCTAAGRVRDHHGYAITGWHVDSADWCFANGAGGVGYCSPSTFAHVPTGYRGDMVGYTLSQIRDSDGGVVLFHDIHQNTVNHLSAIVDTLLQEGFTFTNLDDASTFPLLNGQQGSSSSAECLSCIEHGGGAACAPYCPAGDCRSCVENQGGLACLPRCGG